jgi:hypothetical protein
VLLVVVEDLLDALDTGVLLLGILLLGGGLVPVENAADKGRDEEGAGLSGGDGLDLGEHEGQVAVDAVLGLQDLGGLDALPCRGELDEDALLIDALLLVELVLLVTSCESLNNYTYVNDAQGLVYGGLGVEGETRVDLGGDLSGYNLENFLAELDQQVVKRAVNLLLDILSVLLAELDSGVDQLLVLFFLGRGEDERGVGRRILGLVLVDGRKVTGVADDSLHQLAAVLAFANAGRRGMTSPRAPVGDMAGHLRSLRPSIDRVRMAFCSVYVYCLCLWEERVFTGV